MHYASCDKMIKNSPDKVGLKKNKKTFTFRTIFHKHFKTFLLTSSFDTDRSLVMNVAFQLLPYSSCIWCELCKCALVVKTVKCHNWTHHHTPFQFISIFINIQCCLCVVLELPVVWCSLLEKNLNAKCVAKYVEQRRNNIKY